MNIFDEIKQIIGEILDLEAQAITPESYLIRELGAESIDLLELAAALQVAFRIEVNEADLFLQGARASLLPAEAPFLTRARLAEIAADLAGGPVIKVKDLVSYVDWKLNKP